jgi:hypothetical protein
MTQETVLKVRRAIELVGEVKEEGHEVKALASAVRGAEIALTGVLFAAADLVNATGPATGC